MTSRENNNHGITDHIHRVPVYTPFGTPPTNVYVLKGDRVGLFDTGVGHPRTRAELHEGLRALGVESGDVELVVVSHGHIDHHGLAHEFPGAEVRVGRRDLHKITDFSSHLEQYAGVAAELLSSWGVPPEPVEELRGVFREFDQMGKAVPGAALLEEGDVLEGFGPPLRVLELPGHTEGLIGLFRDADGVLLSSDHLLESITPNPGLYTVDDPPRSGLTDYLESLRRVQSLPVRWVLPGHGQEFPDSPHRIEAILSHHAGRLDLIRKKAGEGKTVFQITRELFSHLDATNIFLAVREVYGHLEILERRNLVEKIPSGDERGSDLYVAA